MIEVEGLTKRYGRQGRPALDGVSFEVGRGEIVGLLGPNGAGKTTMMRILACFLEPTRGRATLAGASIAEDPRAVRRALGYLPEAVPLPPEMRVLEYLTFRAALKGIARRARTAAVDETVGQVGLGDRRRQIIATLSRGYRQRVGLADALLGRPPILILDEPTVGLDPNQIRETRELVRELGRERAILLSTHVLPEVEAVATRIVILHEGRIAAAQTPDELRAQLRGARRIVLEIRPGERPSAEPLLRGLVEKNGIAAVEWQGDTRVLLTGAEGDEAELRDEIFRAFAGAGLGLRELRAEGASLEELFARVTS